ncbi:general secretion pathway protein D [Rubritalea squalenifaciens DSM 18772]|uniref:General secretion pathway protein D n=1 Tax=Rubritalea squalenifaciens DSM 18772 TaxID=1123071 RepID=A0A1M6I8Z6_9BACT|nr:Amuc_1098 family type IV pilus outer membrane protein [Rubritalea squalenifaciens]SHJ30954.1 general secretion pathway protein D [Rubritalea squalenifaciens DSM 18772]
MEKPLSSINPGMRWSARNAIAACAVGCMFYSASITGGYSQESDNSLVQREVAKRSKNLAQAKQHLLSGDGHYKKQEYAEAVSEYSKAFDVVPSAGLANDVRFVVADRYAQAATEYARGLAKNGQYDQARALLDKVLQDDVAPGHVGAMTLLAQVDDPIRYNTALTPEHVQQIEKVAHGLRRAEGYFMLGQYDLALVTYEEVLQLDKYNKAARRGMEKVAKTISDYSVSASDHTRAEFLKKVDEAWETKVNPKIDLSGINTPGGLSTDVVNAQRIRGSKFKQMVIPVVDFQDIDIQEALDVLRHWSRQYDTTELDPDKKGFNFILRAGDPGSDVHKGIFSKKISLQLRNVPMDKVLDYVTRATDTQWRVEDYAVVLTPGGMLDSQLVQRSFTVPPSFMQDAVSGEGAAEDDPFSAETSSSVLRPQLSAQEYLKRLGVSFPEGATASYVRGTNQLSVRNTETNLNLIEDYIRSIRQSESVQVIVNFTILDITQENLQELGYDWLLGQQNLKSNNYFLGGGTTGNGSQFSPVGNFDGLDPVTAGNRSGETMFNNNAIDELIGGYKVPGTVPSRAPGALQVTGFINNSTFQMIMRGLDQKKDESRMFNPSVIVRPGERARLFSGNQLVYPTEYEPPELPNQVGGGNGAFPVTPSTPTAFETVDLGFDFEVEPTVGEDRNYIELRLNPVYTQLDGFIDYGSPISSIITDPITGLPMSYNLTGNNILMPVFSKIRLNTSVTLRDGVTMVVGGLHQSRIDKVEDKVPVLGDIPFIGRFFQSSGYRPTKRALVMFVHAKLVDPTGKAWADR